MNKQTWKCDICKTEIELSCDCNSEKSIYTYQLTRDEAMDVIKKMGERQCCYIAPSPWPHWCDCKYGGPEKLGGEKTGCPELADILRVLENMTDNEWMRRINAK